MSLVRVVFLGLDTLRSTIIFLDDEPSMNLATSLTEGFTISITISLTEGSEEEDEGTNLVEWGADTEMLSTNLIQFCQKTTFEHSAFDQV